MDADRIVVSGAESRGLTGLRGLAAMLVVAHHATLRFGLEGHARVLYPLLRRGYLGVDLFFVLSGFVMSMAYADWFDGAQPGDWPRYGLFLSRRVARLWPLHAAVLAVLLLTRTGSAVYLSRHLLVANVAMIQAWWLSAEINPPAWSVSTEMLAYLLFPMLVRVAVRGRMGPGLCLAGVVAGLAACLVLAPPIGPERRGLLDIYYNYSPLPALRCLSEFTIGILAWRAGRLPVVVRWAATAWLGPAALLLAGALMLLRASDLAVLALAPVVVLGLHLGDGPAHRLLSRGPIYRLGVLSYAIYLVHYALLWNLPLAGMSDVAATLMFTVVLLTLATGMHRLVEVPGRRRLRRAGDAALWWAASWRASRVR